MSAEFNYQDNGVVDGTVVDGVALTDEAVRSHPINWRRVTAALGLAGTAAGVLSACGQNGDAGFFSASTTYYEYAYQSGTNSVFYGCGPGGGVIESLGDIEQTTAKQLKEASIGQGGKCVLTIPAGKYNPVEGTIYSYHNGVMTNLYHCDDNTEPITPVSTQPSGQPYVEQSGPLTYSELQSATIKIQNAHGNTDAIEAIFANDLGIPTPFYSTTLKQNVINDLSVTYPESSDDATASEQEGKDYTLASNLIDATDAPFQIGNADAVGSEIQLGTGDSPFYVTAFYAPKVSTPTPAETQPSPCATSRVLAEGQSYKGTVTIKLGGAVLQDNAELLALSRS